MIDHGRGLLVTHATAARLSEVADLIDTGQVVSTLTGRLRPITSPTFGMAVGAWRATA